MSHIGLAGEAELLRAMVDTFLDDAPPATPEPSYPAEAGATSSSGACSTQIACAREPSVTPSGHAPWSGSRTRAAHCAPTEVQTPEW